MPEAVQAPECTCQHNPETGFRLAVVCPKHDGEHRLPAPQTLQELAAAVRTAGCVYRQAHERWQRLHADIRDADNVLQAAGEIQRKAYENLREFLERPE